MGIKLEELAYQQTAIKSVVDVFDGTIKNTFDNSSNDGIRSNRISLAEEEVQKNIKSIIRPNK